MPRLAVDQRLAAVGFGLRNETIELRKVVRKQWVITSRHGTQKRSGHSDRGTVIGIDVQQSHLTRRHRTTRRVDAS